MWNDDASTNYQRDVDRVFLLGASDSETIALDDVIVDAVVTAERGGDRKSHHLLEPGRSCAFEVRVVVDVVEALDQVVIGGFDVLVEFATRAGELARDLAFVGDLLFGEEVFRLAIRLHGAKDNPRAAERKL
jgi:hypothetical protein